MCAIQHTVISFSANFVVRSIHDKEMIMGKERHGTKEGKKQAVLTPKEKKVAKQVKKHEKTHPVPLINR